MGKHKHKSKKHNKYKKRKKSHKKNSSSSEDEWVEKKITKNSLSNDVQKQAQEQSSNSDPDAESSSHSDEESTLKRYKRNHIRLSSDQEKNIGSKEACNKHDTWMGLPTSFLTISNSDRVYKRNEQRRIEREKQQYNPRECERELNPYWKHGGDGLPKFEKPEDSDEDKSHTFTKKLNSINRTSNWKKKDEEKHCLSSKTDIENYEDNQFKEIIEEDNENISEKELNMLGAKLVKAEILGNMILVNELKDKLEKARNYLKKAPSSLKEDAVLLTHTDSQGRSQPIKLQSEYGESSNRLKRKKKLETHEDGRRVRYYADDDKYSLKQMFENEKYNTVENHNSEFIKMISKVSKNDDLDDVFSDNIRNKESDSKVDSRNRDRAIHQHQKISTSLDSCNKCIQSESMLKHLMISMGETAYLALPPYQPLTEGHCLIVPIRHVPCSTQLDENEWSDILDLRKSLIKLFKVKKESVVFFEYAMSLHQFPHMQIECIPLPEKDGDMAPIYFKKAIDQSETEWAQNKKLVSLKGRDVRRAIPKGLPYFFVSFGMEEGYAHVIEDEHLFPSNFAQEIIGGMLDLHHSKWRKPKKESFSEQSRRVLEFSKEWKHFDCTA